MKSLITTILSALLFSSCNSTKPLETEAKLNHIAYWGWINARTMEFNAGERTSTPIRLPVWASETTLVVSSVRLYENVGFKGLFFLEIANDGLESYEFLEFLDPVIDLAYCEATGRVLVVASADGRTRLEAVGLDGKPTTLITSDWAPLGVVATGGGEVIFYGRDPEVDRYGFFRRSKSNRFDLVLETTLAEEDAAGFDFHDNRLVFARQTGSSQTGYQLEIVSFDLSTSHQKIILEVSGLLGAVSINRDHPSLLLLAYFEIIGEGHILLYNDATQDIQALNVVTEPRSCHWPTSAEPIWSPNGRDFAFTSGSIGCEGDRVGQSLWVYRETP